VRILSLSIILLLLVISGFGQEKAVTEAEYQTALNNGYNVADSRPHRSTRNEESFSKGKKSGYEKHVTETLPPNKSRYIYEAEYDGEREDRQVIKIGDLSYCREGKKKWEKTNCDRFSGIPSNSILTREYSKSEILFENNPITQYRSYMTYSFPQDDAKKTVRTMYSEHKFLIDKEGKIVGSESRVGEVGSKEISSSSKTVYEYGLANLKIEAPIK
jgi:hypothetical protein